MDGAIFIGEFDPSRHHVKILIWRLQENWENEANKSLYFKQFFLHYILFGENFIG